MKIIAAQLADKISKPMKIEIHHYHRISQEDLKLYLTIQKQLINLQETLKIMAETTATRQQLDAAIDNLANVVINGFDGLSETVTKEFSEITAALGGKSGQRDDLTPEIEKLNNLSAALQEKFAQAKTAVEDLVTVSSAEPVESATDLTEKNTADAPTDELPAAPASESAPETTSESSADATGDSTSASDETEPED